MKKTIPVAYVHYKSKIFLEILLFWVTTPTFAIKDQKTDMHSKNTIWLQSDYKMECCEVTRNSQVKDYFSE